MNRFYRLVSAGVLGLFLAGSFALTATLPVRAQSGDQEGKIVPYVPTPQEVVERMLELAGVKKGDVVYDLGSGDGRIVVTAAKKYGVRAVGFEIDPERIKESQENIRKAGVGHLVEIRRQDIRTVDLSQASVLTMYLLPEVNLMIRPNIWKQMKPGSRVVSHDFDMGDWKPLKTEHIKDRSGWDHTLYLWHVAESDKTRDPR
ncbi:MAG TPA: methyltransferase domain-containing protein [candidate division Zixibacteria bacterium]|nr:methyltransferase domain-containing protein [candidate division Zixibacteria bacterium]